MLPGTARARARSRSLSRERESEGRADRAGRAQVALNQTLVATLLNVGFLYLRALLAGAGGRAGALAAATRDVRARLPGIMRANWTVWPLFSFVNLYLVPLEYRVLFMNLVGVAYNTALSYLAYR